MPDEIPISRNDSQKCIHSIMLSGSYNKNIRLSYMNSYNTESKLRVNENEYTYFEITKISESKKIILNNWKDTVSVKEIFFEKEYETLEVKNKIVLDIGANVGDSSILFSRLGAKKVISN